MRYSNRAAFRDQVNFLRRQFLQDGGGVTNLTADEWLQRRSDFLKRHPGRRASP